MASLFELEQQLRAVEQRLASKVPRLWERAFAATILRGIAKELAEQREAEAVFARVQALCLSLSEEDRREVAPLQARIARGEFGRAELDAELRVRPRLEWDAFVERLLGIAELPYAEQARGVEMVHYLASPFEVVLEVVDELRADDVFYDLGAGVGKVTLSAAWLSRARAKGVEREPAYVRLAAERAAALGLERAEMICADAREVDYRDGTVFFLYDPFRGPILGAVLERIRAAGTGPKIRVFSRGACTAVLDHLPWLERKRTSERGLVLYTLAS